MAVSMVPGANTLSASATWMLAEFVLLPFGSKAAGRMFLCNGKRRARAGVLQG